MRRFVSFISAAAIVGIAAAVGHSFTGAAQFDPDAACVGNAKLLSKAVIQFTLDHDEQLPPTNTEAAFQAALQPYVTDPSIFVCPATHTDYTPNPAISELTVNQIGNLHTTVLFQDSIPHADGKITVAHADGSVADDDIVHGDVNQICVDRADQVSIGLIEYVQDHDETYPPMHTPAEFETALLPYVKDSQQFVCPATNKEFVPNANLSGVTLASIADAVNTVAFSDPDAHSDGIETVAYADGHIVHGVYHPSRNNTTGPGSSCRSVEKQLGLAVLQYAQDYDEQLPKYKTYAQFIAEILPYLKNAQLAKCPDTGLDYVLNPALNGISMAYIDAPASTWMIRDAAANSDGSINTVYADGHVRAELNSLALAISVLPDNEARLLWHKADGTTRISTLDAAGAFEKSVTVKSDTTPIVAMTTDTKLRTLALRASGNTDTLQFLDANGNTFKSPANGPYDGWDPIGVGIGPNWQGHLLWKKFDGTASVWTLKADGTYMTDVKYGPIANTKVVALASAPDNSQRLLWFGDNGIPQARHSRKTLMS